MVFSDDFTSAFLFRFLWREAQCLTSLPPKMVVSFSLRKNVCTNWITGLVVTFLTYGKICDCRLCVCGEIFNFCFVIDVFTLFIVCLTDFFSVFINTCVTKGC